MADAAPPERLRPLVRYLDLGGDGTARLVANRCQQCCARYFDERIVCASCGGESFSKLELPARGRVGSFTIVHRASPGIVTPYISAVVYLEDATAVRCNIVGCDPTPDCVTLGMRVKLTTFVAGVDAEGTGAVAFAFERVGEAGPRGES